MTPRTGFLSSGLVLACHLTRLVAVVWLIWGLVRISLIWADPERLLGNYQRLAGRMLDPLSGMQHAVSYLVILAVWAAAGMVVYRLWHLFGNFLAGEILTPGTAHRLRGVAMSACLAVGLDLLARPLLYAIITKGSFWFWADPNDLMHVGIAALLVIFSGIFTTGVTIAEEHRQIV